MSIPCDYLVGYICIVNGHTSTIVFGDGWMVSISLKMDDGRTDGTRDGRSIAMHAMVGTYLGNRILQN